MSCYTVATACISIVSPDASRSYAGRSNGTVNGTMDMPSWGSNGCRTAMTGINWRTTARHCRISLMKLS